MNKKIIALIIIIVAAISVVAGSVFLVNPKESNRSGEDKKAEAVKQGEGQEEPSASGEGKKTYTPTFVYFISNEHLEATGEALERLQEEYKGKVNFDIRNVDETGENLDESIGKENMPALFMHDENNDICALLIKTSDYESLKAAVDTAFED